MDIYLFIEGQQQGPYTEGQVRQSLKEGLIPRDLPGWHEGLEEWVQVDTLISIEAELRPETPLSVQTISGGGTDPSIEPTDQPLNHRSSSITNVRPPFFEQGKRKLHTARVYGVGVGVAATVAICLSLIIGYRIGQTPEKQPSFTESPVTNTAPDATPKTQNDGPPRAVFFDKLIADLKTFSSFSLTGSNYEFQKSGDPTTPWLCELDFTILAESGVPLSFKAYFGYTTTGRWRCLKMTDSNDNPITDGTIFGIIEDYSTSVEEAMIRAHTI